MRKNLKTIIGLLVACFVLWAVIYENEHGLVDWSHGRPGYLLPATLEEVDGITLERQDGFSMEFERGVENEWRIVRPAPALANAAAIAELLDAFEQAPCTDEIDQDEMELRNLTPADFGANDLKGKLVIKGPRTQLNLGIGALASIPDEMFVFMGSSVFVTDPGLLRFFKKSIEDFSDMRLLRNNEKRANVITLNRGSRGFVKMVRDVDYREWKITQPLQVLADQKCVENLLQVLYSSRIDHYAAGMASSPDAMPFRGYGFDGTDAVVVQVATKDDPAGQGVTIGSFLPDSSDQVYIRAGSDGIVGVVTGEVRRVALKSISDLRDKNLFRFRTPPAVQVLSIEAGSASLAFRRTSPNAFSITAPITDKASPTAVSDLLNSIFGLFATRFSNLDKTTLQTSPEVTFSVQTEKKKYKFSLFRVPEESLVEGEQDSFYALSAENLADASSHNVAVPVIPAFRLTPILTAVSDPCPFVSKTVLSLDPKNIRRITSIGGSMTSIVERTDNVWQSVSSTNQPVERSISDWLDVLGDLQAERVMALSRGNDDVYSLSHPSRTLVFELLDGAPPRVVLLLGGHSPDGGVYGRVLGHDVIFVLSESIEKIFVRPLVAPPASMEEGATLPVVELSPPSAKVN